MLQHAAYAVAQLKKFTRHLQFILTDQGFTRLADDAIVSLRGKSFTSWGSGKGLDWRGSSTVRTLGFQPSNQGSTPCRATR